MTKLKLKSDIFNLLINFLVFFLIIFFHTYIDIKMPKNLLAKYYQENKKRLKKLAPERYQNLSKEEEEEEKKN